MPPLWVFSTAFWPMTAIFLTVGAIGRRPPSFFNKTIDFSATWSAIFWHSGCEVITVLATSAGTASIA